jgi:hypothetical protein
MWQQITVVVLVVLAVLYAVWSLSPKQWRKRFGLAPPERGGAATGAGQAAAASKGECGCGNGKDGCH